VLVLSVSLASFLSDARPPYLQVNVERGDFFIDGPLFLKSGVSFSGTWSDDSPGFTFFNLYQGENNGKTSEDAVFVVDGGRGRGTAGVDYPATFKELDA